MFRSKTKEILKRSDYATQRVKWMEELAELIQAIAKGDRENITEEIADVEVVVDQMIVYYDLERLDIEALRRVKQARTLRRLEEGDVETRPCAKCGGHSHIVVVPGSIDCMYLVECKTCGKRTAMYNSKVKAVQDWNENG